MNNDVEVLRAVAESLYELYAASGDERHRVEARRLELYARRLERDMRQHAVTFDACYTVSP